MKGEMQGTRQRQTQRYENVQSGELQNSYTRDVGLNKLVTVSATFASATISAAAGSGTFSAFLKDDSIRISGTNSNNNAFLITAVGTSGASITVAPPTQSEGPITSVIRTI